MTRSRRFLAAPTTQNWQKAVGPRKNPLSVQRSLARSGRHEGLTAKKYHTFTMGTGPRALTMQENTGIVVQRNSSRRSGLIS